MESLHLICNYTTYGIIRNPPISRAKSFVLHSKKSNFQDFQGYAKPVRLLPAYEVKPTTDSSLDKLVSSFNEDKLECLYKLSVQTSNYYGSGLTDPNAGVLLCLVDKNGDSILQRISATSSADHYLQAKDKDESNFQRGSINHFTFEGPAIGILEALWIGVESGQWRPTAVSIICWSRSPFTDNQNHHYSVFQYNFPSDNILLGDKNDLSMIELRPNRITNLSKNMNNTLTLNPWNTTSKSNEETMKEYSDLKFSLLLYDTLLILTGSTIASFTAGENAAFAFLTGGIGGFLYLLLLQRSVDELASPVLDRTGGLNRMVGRFMGQVAILVLALGFAVIVVKVGSGDQSLVLTPKDLVVGMLGFLLSKVAVLLAAFKPVTVGAKESR